MAKLSSAAITETDVREYLATQDDLGLEMRCVGVCRAKGWRVKHGGTYTDPVTKKTRQFDIRAQREKDDQRIYLAVECKALNVSFPLVVSRLPRVKPEAFHEIVYSAGRDDPSSSLLIGDTTKELRFDWKDSCYERSEPVGKHTVQVGRSVQNEIVTGDAESFDKWSQAIASASDLVGEAGSAHEGQSAGYMLSAVIPILVVPDETLWVADYDPEGNLVGSPRSEKKAEVFIEKSYWNAFPAFSYTISHLHIYTASGFDAFLDTLTDSGKGWSQWFPTQAIEKKITGR